MSTLTTRLLQASIAACALLGLAGCSSTSEVELANNFDARVPIRVAVLPFVDRAEGDDALSMPIVALLDVVPVLSDDALDKVHASDVLRVAFLGNLLRSRLNVMDPVLVDSLIAHKQLDLLAAYEGDRERAAQHLGEALAVDAVVFGEVLEWDRAYYVAESVVSAGLRVELRDTLNGGLLFRGEVHDSSRSGVTELPIDFDPIFIAIEVVGESLRGLGNTAFGQLSADLTRQIVEGLVPSGSVNEGAEPQSPPQIRLVSHSGFGPLALGDELSVVAVGDPGALATFWVGPDMTPLPMTESYPGTYRGTLHVSGQHVFANEHLTVRFLGRDFQASSMTVATPPLNTQAPE